MTRPLQTKLSPISPADARALQRFFALKQKEFEHPTLVFDHAHLVALGSGETAIALLEERASRDGWSEWYLPYPHAVAVVRAKKKGMLAYSYKIGSTRASREDLKAVIAVNEFMAAEHRINPGSKGAWRSGAVA